MRSYAACVGPLLRGARRAAWSRAPRASSRRRAARSTCTRCPGAFELPLAAKYCAESGRYAGVACLGAVIRGETDHYEYVCGEAAGGIARVRPRHRRAVRLRRADRGHHGAGARPRRAAASATRARTRPAQCCAWWRCAASCPRRLAPGMAPVNLYSDTQTRPSDGMRRAIATAEVGDEQRGEDPTTLRLEERVAELLGQEAGLFLPSGTMCNQIAFRLHARPGRRRADPRPHRPPDHRRGRAARRGTRGLMIHALDGDGGIFSGRPGARRDPPRLPLHAALAAGVGRADHQHGRRPRSGRSRRSARCSRWPASTACARTWTARG